MEEFKTIESTTNQQEKRPVFLTVLCVLSFITIGFVLMSSILALMNGPVSNEMLEESLLDMYGMLSFYEEQGVAFMVDFIQTTIDASFYLNNETFYLNQTLGFISLIVGLVGVVYMFKRRKIGYHFYIIYSILPVITLYLVLPKELISTVFIIASLLLSGIFCLLYGLNLKHMK